MSKKIHNLFNTLHKTINDYSIGQEPYDTTLKKLATHKNTLLQHYLTWAPTPAQLLERCDHHKADPILITAVAHLTIEAQKPITDEFLPYLALIPLVAPYAPTNDVIRIFQDIDQTHITTAVETTFEHEDSHLNAALSLIPLISDEATFNKLTQLALEDASPEQIANGLQASAKRAFAVARQAQQQGDDSNFMMNVVLRLGNQCASIPDQDVYIEALGHQLNTFKELAQLGISNQGANARALLEQGAKSRKKATKTWCKQQLAIIGDAPTTQTTEAVDQHAPNATANAFEALDEEAQLAVLKRIDALDKLKDATWKKWLKNEVAPNPMVWMLGTIRLFADNPEDIHRWKIFQTLLTHDTTKAHHEALWSVYLHHLARNPSLKNTHTQFHIKKHFKLIPRPIEQTVLDHALLGASAPMTIPMLEHYYAVRLCSPDILMMGIIHKSKKVRDAALNGAHFWPSDVDAQAIVELLNARKKDTRLYAAKALTTIPNDCVAPHKDTIQALVEKEKYDDVSEAINTLLTQLND